MTDFPKLLHDALKRVTVGLDVPTLAAVTADTNVFESVDSFTIVDLLLETEVLLEAETGKYIALADETVFDAERSPLLKWSNWVEFVEEHHRK